MSPAEYTFFSVHCSIIAKNDHVEWDEVTDSRFSVFNVDEPFWSHKNALCSLNIKLNSMVRIFFSAVLTIKLTTHACLKSEFMTFQINIETQEKHCYQKIQKFHS